MEMAVNKPKRLPVFSHKAPVSNQELHKQPEVLPEVSVLTLGVSALPS
jgi:hypothetical protein